jgi:hypothetical protein
MGSTISLLRRALRWSATPPVRIRKTAMMAALAIYDLPTAQSRRSNLKSRSKYPKMATYLWIVSAISRPAARWEHCTRGEAATKRLTSPQSALLLLLARDGSAASSRPLRGASNGLHDKIRAPNHLRERVAIDGRSRSKP